MKGFWREFVSGDNSKVNTMAVISMVLAGPVVLLATIAIIYHVFYLGRGLDNPTVSLFLGMLGAATGGLGASMFSRSMGGFMGGGYQPPHPPVRMKKE